MKRYIIIFPLLIFALALINYRGAQYDIENDTWWGATNDLQSSWRELTQPVMACDSVPVITDRLGRTYCYNEWHYYDRNGNLHFNVSRLIVLSVWYVYIFIGPFVLLIFILSHFAYNRLDV